MANPWTWVSGSNGINQVGTYGTKGVASSANVPGARAGSVSWIDSIGNLWLFGGGVTIIGVFNDLWKFDGTDWTWVSGSSTGGQIGTYGTKGVAAVGNVPGGRRGAVSWIDASGNLWLFGGVGYNASSENDLNDLWKFDGANWTWMSGSNMAAGATYGAKGVAAAGNVPGGRRGAVSWIDGTGKLWLFGGYGYPESGPEGYLNDLWKFDGTNWTWMSGSKAADQLGTYGTKGTTAPTNVPGARTSSTSWIDSSSNLWLFGGSKASDANCFNDLWKFDGANWTWVSGSNATDQFGTYGTKGIGTAVNIPGARRGSTAWKDEAGDFWLFGGYSYFGSSQHHMNDLWKYDGTNWTWVSGSSAGDQVGTYGTKGIAASGNAPGSRYLATSWIDSTGNLWLFGGDGPFNDLWKVKP